MIEQVAWTTEVDNALSDPAGAFCRTYLRAEVERGISKLWRCTSGTSVAFVVTRVDENPRELVVCYVEGRGMAEHAQTFIDAARVMRVPLRIHTTKPSVCRWLARYGFKQEEFVLRRH